MRRPYVLDGSPLLDFCLIRLADDQHWLAGQAHHLIIDGWGFAQLFKSLGELYSALIAGKDLELLAPGYSAFIADDARYQASQRYSLDRAYWLENTVICRSRCWCRAITTVVRLTRRHPTPGYSHFPVPCMRA